MQCSTLDITTLIPETVMYDTFEVPNMIANATVSPRRIVTENTSQDITISMPNSQEFVKNVFI